MMKHKIKAENPNMVLGDAKDLDLYRGEIEIGDDDTPDTIKSKIDAKMAMNQDPLNEYRTLDTLFPRGFAPRRIHIIVVVPEAVQRM